MYMDKERFYVILYFVIHTEVYVFTAIMGLIVYEL